MKRIPFQFIIGAINFPLFIYFFFLSCVNTHTHTHTHIYIWLIFTLIYKDVTTEFIYLVLIAIEEDKNEAQQAL